MSPLIDILFNNQKNTKFKHAQLITEYLNLIQNSQIILQGNLIIIILQISQKKLVQCRSMKRQNHYDDTEEKTVIQIATQLVDSVTDLLFSQIKTGSLIVDDQQIPLQVVYKNTQQNNNDEQNGINIKNSRSKLIMKMNTVDIDEHRKMMKRFISQNRKFKRQREMRSMEMSQRSIKFREQQDKDRQESRNKMLEQRRKQIQKRMQAKKSILKQIQKSTLQANTTVAEIRKKKFLYQQKQQQFYKKTILPKIQQQNEMLQQRKKSYRQPMNMEQILQHQRHYETLRINSRVNRSLTISVIKTKEKQYHPPEFVPKSYKKVQQEEQRARLQAEMKEREVEVNQIRKKEFVKKIDEIRQKERQLQKSRQKQLTPEKQKQQVKIKPKLNRQQIKNVGNEYLKQLLAKNRKNMATKKVKPLQIVESSSIQVSHKPKSEYEIEIIKQQRIQHIHKIRHKKITELIHNKKMDEHTKQQKLLHEIEKLDLQAQRKMKDQNNIENINQSALIMMNAIEAKMALLGVEIGKMDKTNNKKQQGKDNSKGNDKTSSDDEQTN